jgi:hypothetical protein
MDIKSDMEIILIDNAKDAIKYIFVKPEVSFIK